MPKITQYDAPDNLGLRPTELGISAVGNAARRVEGNYREAAAATSDTGQRLNSAIQIAGDTAVRYIDHQQISHGANAFANLTADKSKKWDETVKTADPNDPTVQQKFIQDEIEPAIEDFKKGFLTERGQAWAESRADAFRNHMFQKTSADMAALAGEAAKVNFRQTTNGLTNTVRGDPSSLDFSLATLRDSVGAMVDSSPNLTGVNAARVKGELLQKGEEAIVKSAAIGYIEKTGQVPDWVSDEKYSKYIDGNELKQFAQTAKYYQRLTDSEGRAARQQRDYEAKVDFNAKVNDLRIKTMPQETGARPTLPPDYWKQVRDLSQHPGAALEPGLLKSLMSEGDAITNRLNKPEPLSQVSQRSTVELFKRFRATDDSRLDGDAAVKAIYDEYDAGKLRTSDFRSLLNEVQGNTPEQRALRQDRNEFFKRYLPQIDPTLGVGGLEGEKLYQAEMDARRMEDVLRKKGLDPHLVYQTGSEYFFGRPENVAKYRPSLQEKAEYDARQKALRNKPDASVAPAQPSAFVAPPTWQWSPSRRQYRDPATNTMYDAAGKQVR